MEVRLWRVTTENDVITQVWIPEMNVIAIEGWWLPLTSDIEVLYARTKQEALTALQERKA